jgi:hypothetical protein
MGKTGRPPIMGTRDLTREKAKVPTTLLSVDAKFTRTQLMGALNLNFQATIDREATQLSEATWDCVGLNSRVQTSSQIVNPDNLANRVHKKITTGWKSGRKGWGPQQEVDMGRDSK